MNTPLENRFSLLQNLYPLSVSSFSHEKYVIPKGPKESTKAHGKCGCSQMLILQINSLILDKYGTPESISLSLPSG